MSVESLVPLDPESVLAVLERLVIPDKVSGSLIPWVPTAEQRRMAHESCANDWLIVAKPRQIYASTYFCAEDVLWTLYQDNMGQRVTTAIVVDTDAKAHARLEVCRDFARQMPGVRYSYKQASGTSPARIVFENGSQIQAFTAGGRRAGSSVSFQRFHFTELPYWPKATEAYGSLMPALSRLGQVKIETTMDIIEPLAKNLWVTPNRFSKLFFGVEDHESYRADQDSISDERWAELQAEGYTDRAAAAWFNAVIDSEFGGDTTHAFRLYPQKPEHMWQSSEGRFIGLTPQVVKPARVEVVDGVAESWRLEVYRDPLECSEQIVIGVDTAAGKERDRSAVAVVDKRDGQLVASFVSDTIWPDDLAKVARRAQALYVKQKPVPSAASWIVSDPGQWTPVVVVEDNGIGAATWQACLREGVRGMPVTTTEDSKIRGMLHVKRAVERGRLWGPRDLADECDEIHRDDLGRFKGRKDLCMALGFALNHIAEAPYIAPTVPEDRNVFRLDRAIAAERRRLRGR
ncbi:MAG: hypothetical protein VW405_01585 [Rhodospirillaceae bacterium]